MDNVQYPLDRLHIRRMGTPDQPMLLLLHGWGSSQRDMEPLARALAEDYYIVLADLPGHGNSPPPDTPWGVPEFSALVARLIKQEHPTSVTIVGHSNGGRIALFMSSEPRYKELIDRLILISPSGITPQRSWGYYLRLTTAKLLKAPFLVLPPAIRRRSLNWLRSTMLWKALGSSDYQKAQGVMRESFVKTVTFHLDEQVQRISVPTLVFWGNQDTAISHRQVAYLEQNIPDAGLVVLENAGHYGHLDSLSTCVAATRYFLTHTTTDASA